MRKFKNFDEVKMVVGDANLEWALTAMKVNGYVIKNSYPRRKYWLFGPVVTVFTFVFFPSNETIKRFIENCEAQDAFEEARKWQNILDQRNQIK